MNAISRGEALRISFSKYLLDNFNLIKLFKKYIATSGIKIFGPLEYVVNSERLYKSYKR